MNYTLNNTTHNATSNRAPRKLAWRLVASTAVLALAASVAQTATAMPHGPGGGDMGGPPGMGMMGGRHGERLLDSVGASADQKAQIQKIMDSARADLKPLRDAARALHQQAQGLFTQPNVDANAVEAVRLQLSANHDQASKRMMQAMLDASRVLTPDQRKQMADKAGQARSMMQRHRAERESLSGSAPKP